MVPFGGRKGTRANHPGIVEGAIAAPKGLRGALLRHRNRRAIAAREETSLVEVRQMGHLKATGIAFLTLFFVLGIAIGEMYAGGAVLHAFVPSHHFDIFYALHQQLVVGSLIGLSIVWLIPPHPWATQLVEKAVDKPAQSAGQAGGGDAARVTALAQYEGRDPPHRPRVEREVGG